MQDFHEWLSSKVIALPIRRDFSEEIVRRVMDILNEPSRCLYCDYDLFKIYEDGEEITAKCGRCGK